MIRVRYALLACCGALFMIAGCSNPALDPAVLAAHRTRLELAEEPDGAQTVLEVRQVMFGEEPAEVDEHADHEHEDGEHADHEHDEAEHADDEQADHDHDGDGVQDHAAEDHDRAIADANKKPVIDELDVVLVGSVGGVPNPSDQSYPEFPFSKGQAVFFLAEPEAVAEIEEHAHVHADGEECAFCAAHAADSAHMLAVVQFTDEHGKTLPVDVRDLFDLKEKETVVVRGKAKVDPSGMLIVDATGLYIRR